MNRASYLSSFCLETAGMLRRGMPVPQALETSGRAVGHARWREALLAASERCREGASLSEALSNRPSLFPPDLIGVLRAGERHGDLPQSLLDLGHHYALASSLRSHVMAGLLYPTVSLVVSAVVVGLIFAFVIPEFALMYDDFGIVLPRLTAFLVSPYAIVVLPAVFLLPPLAIVLLYGSDRAFRSSPLLSRTLCRWRFQMPLFGALFRLLVLNRFLQTLGSLLKADTPVPEALALSAESLPDASARQAVLNTAAATSEGWSLAGNLPDLLLIPPYIAWSISIGEQRGELGPIVLSAAEEVGARTRDKARSFRFVFVALTIPLLGGVVGLIVTGLFKPLIDIMGHLGS